MEIKQRISDTSSSRIQKGKNLFSGTFSKESEIQALNSEIKGLSPAAKNTLLTLI